MADNLAHCYNQCCVRVLTINDLPDEILLAIFDFYVVKLRGHLVSLEDCNYNSKRKIESWQTLIHVCRRWRCLVFGSPSRLNLQLCCTPRTSVRMSLDVWPALPLLILGAVFEASMDDIISLLKHSDRITQIQMDLHRYIFGVEALWTAMQVPFPELSDFYLSLGDMSLGPVLPDSLLGGSAPRLRHLTLDSVPFLGLPNLLLSATHLVYLCLLHIPRSGYLSPETITTCLSMLTSLKAFRLEFGYPRSSNQESRRPPPPTRAVLPSLTTFWFRGANKYLEDLVSRIDTPLLRQLSTTFFDGIDFDTLELNQFIRRTPIFGEHNAASLSFHNSTARFILKSHPVDQELVRVEVDCKVPRRQPSSLAQICTSSLHLLLMVENLYIYEDSPPDWKGDIENAEWLGLLLPFTAVKNLYLSKISARNIAPALQELIEERTKEVLPALQNIFFEGFQASEPVQENISQFISARQLTNYPVAVSVWER